MHKLVRQQKWTVLQQNTASRRHYIQQHGLLGDTLPRVAGFLLLLLWELPFVCNLLLLLLLLLLMLLLM